MVVRVSITYLTLPARLLANVLVRRSKRLLHRSARLKFAGHHRPTDYNRDRLPASARQPASHWPRDQSLAAIERPHRWTRADPCRIAECHLGTVVEPEYPCARGRNAGLVKFGGHQILATSAEMPPSSREP